MVILVEDLTDLQTLEAELAHSDRLASIGRLAAGVAHEIGNPLTGIDSLAQNLKYETDPEIIRQSIEQILTQTHRISDIVQSLISFSHAGSRTDRPVAVFRLHDCVAEAIRLVQLSHAGKQLKYANDVPDDLEIKGDRQRLLQVFVNLLNNARDASRPGDTIEVHATTGETQVEILVIDQGTGIPEELLDRVFDPFFTTKQPGEGTGLGLPWYTTSYRTTQAPSPWRALPDSGPA